MKARLDNRRAAATLLAATALLVGGAAGAAASTQSPLGGRFGSPAGTQTAPATSPLPGLGMFKALFALFGAVRVQVPTIAAPIINQALRAGTITPAEAAQLTSWLSGQHAQPMTGAATTPTRPSAGELAVLRRVLAAVAAQLPAIAAPVLTSEVKNGDLTPAQADVIAKLLARLAAGPSAATGPAASTPASAALGASAASGTLFAALESQLTAQVKKATKHHHHKTAKPALKAG